MNERRGVQARVIALIAALALVIGAVVLASTAQSLAAQEDEEEPVPALESELTAEELVEEEPVPGQIECYWISAEAITRETVDVLVGGVSVSDSVVRRGGERGWSRWTEGA
jgi:hypothetical protein